MRKYLDIADGAHMSLTQNEEGVTLHTWTLSGDWAEVTLTAHEATTLAAHLSPTTAQAPSIQEAPDRARILRDYFDRCASSSTPESRMTPDRHEAILGIIHAVADSGRMPSIHRSEMRRLSKKWPTLASALVRLLGAYGHPDAARVRRETLGA